MGCQWSFVLSNAVRKGIKGEKVGIDLFPCQPAPGTVHLVGSLTNTRLPSNHFDIVTCLSVIEHGVDVEAFADEAVRLLKVGGWLFVTFDDRPTRIVSNIKLYGLDWTIFCELMFAASSRSVASAGRNWSPNRTGPCRMPSLARKIILPVRGRYFGICSRSSS